MRKIMSIRTSSGRENKEILKHRLVPVFVTALLLVFSIICVAAAELADVNESQAALSSELSEAGATEQPQKPERATVTVSMPNAIHRS